MLTKIDYEIILNDAHYAAEQAVAKLGPEDLNALDCGFAWVTIPGNSPLARFCRKQVKTAEAIGDKTYQTSHRYGSHGYPKGWQFWKPGNFPGQAIGHHIAGARAFNEVLARYNIVGTLGSRYD